MPIERESDEIIERIESLTSDNSHDPQDRYDQLMRIAGVLDQAMFELEESFGVEPPFQDDETVEADGIFDDDWGEEFDGPGLNSPDEE